MLLSSVLPAFVGLIYFGAPVFALPQPNSLASRIDQDIEKATPFPFNEADASVLEDAFGAIAAIPSSVLDDGKDAVRKWLNTHSHNTVKERDIIPLGERHELNAEKRQWLQIAKCALAIGQAIVENEFPIAKLRRFKELIELLGGAKKVAKMLLKAKSFSQFVIIGGPELAEIGELLLGLQGVVGACFSWV